MIRLWKLGSLEHRIFPTTEAINRLTTILSEWDGKSPLDIVWGPEIELQRFEYTKKSLDIITSSGDMIEHIGSPQGE